MAICYNSDKKRTNLIQRPGFQYLEKMVGGEGRDFSIWWRVSLTHLFCLSPLHNLTQCRLNLNWELFLSREYLSRELSSISFPWIWLMSQVLFAETLASPALQRILSDPLFQPGPCPASQRAQALGFCGHRRRRHLLSASLSPFSGAGLFSFLCCAKPV